MKRYLDNCWVYHPVSWQSLKLTSFILFCQFLNISKLVQRLSDFPDLYFRPKSFPNLFPIFFIQKSCNISVPAALKGFSCFINLKFNNTYYWHRHFINIGSDFLDKHIVFLPIHRAIYIFSPLPTDFQSKTTRISHAHLFFGKLPTLLIN